VSNKNTTHKTYNQSKTEENRGLWKDACHAHKIAERNETRHTGAFTRALKEHKLSLKQLEDLNARLDELGKHIRELESPFLENEKALGRGKRVTSDPPEGPVRTGTKSATPSQRSRSPHGSASTEGMVDSGNRTGKRVKHAFVRGSRLGGFERVKHEVPKGRVKKIVVS
jgi:hypothetical protein